MKYFPIYQCLLCTERLKRDDIYTIMDSAHRAIQYHQLHNPMIPHIRCKGDGIHGVCQLIGVEEEEGEG